MKPRSPIGASIRLLPVVLAGAACGSSETTVRMQVEYDADWNLDALRVTAQDQAEPSPVASELTVLVPDAWAGEAFEIRVDGMRGDERIASGQVEVMPRLGREVAAEVVLALADGEMCPSGTCECTDECASQGESTCTGSGTATCDDHDGDGCLEWGPEAPCPGDASCVDGECGCPERECAVAIIATGQDAAQKLALDQTHVYWTNHVGDQVMRQARTGGEIETVASAQDGALGIAMDDTHVYWTAYFAHQVMRRAKAGGEVETIASDQDGPDGIALDETHVYWTNAGGQVMRRTKARGEVETIASEQAIPDSVAVDETHVYWANIGATDEIRRRAKAGGETEQIASGGSSDYFQGGLAVDATHVFWTNDTGALGASGAVERRAKGGGDVTTFAAVEDEPNTIVLDDTHVYWTHLDGGGEVRRKSKSGGDVETLASLQDEPVGLAVDAGDVYWTSAVGDYVARLSRCACGL